MAESTGLSRRERQIMDVIYALGQATAIAVVEHLPDPPTRTAVRTLLRILEAKGHVEHQKIGRQFVYRPTRPRAAEGRSALRRILRVFFDGSIEKAVAAYLAEPGSALTPAEVDGLNQLIREAKKRKDNR